MMAAHGIVDVNAEMLADAIAIEQRRKDLFRDCGGDEQRVGHQRLDDGVAQLPRDCTVWRQLLVLLDHRRLRAGRRVAVFPLGSVHRSAKIGNFHLAQNIRHTDQHKVSLANASQSLQASVRTLELESLQIRIRIA
jgi:hypothetical protein